MIGTSVIKEITRNDVPPKKKLSLVLVDEVRYFASFILHVFL